MNAARLVNAPERILIVRLSSIGDVIHSLPAFQALREALPDAEIGWAVERAAAPLVRSLTELDHVHELDVQGWRRSPLRWSTWQALREALTEIRGRRYQIGLDLQGLWKSAILGRVSAAQLVGLATPDLREPGARVLYHRQAAAATTDRHVIARRLELVRTVCPGAPSATRWPPLADSKAQDYVREKLEAFGATPVLIHSAANWSSKEFADSKWVEVGRGIHAATKRPVLWLWGPGEEARARDLAAQAGDGNYASFPTELPHLAALAAQSALVIGGDSAPLHLAVACGAPVVALFGPTDPARLGPTGTEDRVVVRRLECSHCHRRKCPLGTNECLDSIGPDEIVQAAIARLADRAAEER